MKKLFILLILCVLLSAQTEVLNTINEFNAPSSSCWGIAYDGENFWITDDSLCCIYQINNQGDLIQSYYYQDLILRGITFHNNELWVLNDVDLYEPTPTDTTSYESYNIYNMNKFNGEIIDSISITIPLYDPLDRFHVWGMAFCQSNLYVSYNGGWGPCTYEIDTGKKEIINSLCCVHPVGLTTINETLWCILNNTTTDLGNYIVELEFVENPSGLSETDKLYEIDCKATDLTFDGENIWICDYTNKKIKKLEEIPTHIVAYENCQPSAFRLEQNYPNPFNPSTSIGFEIPENSKVEISIYSIIGEKIVTLINNKLSTGYYTVNWNGRDHKGCELSSGIYIYLLRSADNIIARKMILNK